MKRTMTNMKVFTSIMAACIIIAISGCGVVPIKPEILYPVQDLDANPGDEPKTRLIVFNDSNRWFFGEDRAGKLNVFIGGKAAGTLNIGQYLVLALDGGDYDLDLHHRDILNFRSTHSISVSGREQYLKVYAKILSNGALLLQEQPEKFDSDFKAAY